MQANVLVYADDLSDCSFVFSLLLLDNYNYTDAHVVQSISQKLMLSFSRFEIAAD